MDYCDIVKKSGKQCKYPGLHKYQTQTLCEKHWNHGRLTKAQPKAIWKEARRRISALQEFPLILAYVMDAVVKNKRMSYREMADMALEAARDTNILNKKERRDIVRLIITSVRLRRECKPNNEKSAIRSIGELIQDICGTASE